MGRAAAAEKAAESGASEAPLRWKTERVLRYLGCKKTTLWELEKTYPALFAPVKRQHNGNIYRREQVEIMADVMDGLIEPEAGIELWERCKATRSNTIYRNAGDPTRN